MKPIRVMLVDDSVVVRLLVADVLSSDSRVQIRATAVNGEDALAKLRTDQIDVVILDVEMPVMDGLSTLRELRKRDAKLPVIMFSTLTEHGARTTMEALTAGASDYVTKPANLGSIAASRAAVRAELLPKLLALGQARQGGQTRRQPSPTVSQPQPQALAPTTRTSTTVPTAPIRPKPVVKTAATPRGRVGDLLAPTPAATPRPRGGSGPRIVVVGSSTGGPAALNLLLPGLASLELPMLITQHMPPLFTTMLAERLDRSSPLSVREAAGRESIVPGTVFVAPGNFHLIVDPHGGPIPTTALSSEAPVNHCRPSVDVMFRSVAKVYGAAVLAVVLTGMGSDGMEGARAIVAAGGQVIVQDRDTSVVWGMPGAVATEGLAAQVLPLDQIAAAVLRRVGSGVMAVRAQ